MSLEHLSTEQVVLWAVVSLVLGFVAMKVFVVLALMSKVSVLASLQWVLCLGIAFLTFVLGTGMLR